MRVKLSGGPNRSRDWGVANTKKEVMKLLRKFHKNITFVDYGDADYIVIADSTRKPSKTASKTQGVTMHLSDFIAHLKKLNKKGSRTKTSTRKASVRTTSTKRKTSTKR